MIEIPRHWEEDRPVTWEEYAGPYGGLCCMDCDVRLTSFEMTAKRLTDDTMVELSFSDEPVIPIVEVVCTNCAEKP